MADFDEFKAYFEPKGYRMGYLATVGARGRPALRPVTFFLSGRKLYFCTTTGDAKVKQIRKDRRLEICIPVNRGRWRGYYRIAGDADLVKDRRARQRVAKNFPAVEKHWEGPHDPNLTIVEVKRAASRYLPPGKAAEVDVKL
ncbi:MAG: pyridoxamine 5'-phosphate oxidase family protein [Candidatus Coatesbacteria bacterium]|nr:MAG: pyridoxamine 5'-phosphate oxidase family protein [Candidatus Coatesbacteria bacterium]